MKYFLLFLFIFFPNITMMDWTERERDRACKEFAAKKLVLILFEF